MYIYIYILINRCYFKLGFIDGSFWDLDFSCCLLQIKASSENLWWTWCWRDFLFPVQAQEKYFSVLKKKGVRNNISFLLRK